MAIQQTYSKMKIVFFKFHSSINSFLNWRLFFIFLFSFHSIYNLRRCNGIIRMEFNSFSFPFSSSSSTLFFFNDSWFHSMRFYIILFVCILCVFNWDIHACFKAFMCLSSIPLLCMCIGMCMLHFFFFSNS
jgi:hypothetical protein